MPRPAARRPEAEEAEAPRPPAGSPPGRRAAAPASPIASRRSTGACRSTPATSPRCWPRCVIAAAVLTSGFGLIGGDDDGGGAQGGKDGGGKTKEEKIEVAVLNATQEQTVGGTEIAGVQGLADGSPTQVVKPARLQDVGEKTNASSGFEQTTIMFEPEAEADAQELAAAVADQLGEPDVTPMIGEVRDRAGGAPLALVVGRDDADFGRASGHALAASARSSTRVGGFVAPRRAARGDPARCRSISPSAATSSGCAPGWSASPIVRRPTSLDAERAGGSTPPRPSSRSITRRHRGRRAGARQATPAGPDARRRPGSPTSARRSSGSRWSARRSRRTRAGAASSTGSPSRGCWSRSAPPRCCSAPARSSPRRQLLSNDERPRGPQSARIDPGEVEVAVLNGTSINGLAGRSLRPRGRAATRWSRSPTRRPASRTRWSSTRTARSRRRRRSPATSG